jgi:hypothetical protein
MNSMGPGNFNFKDLAMKKAKPIHGSSPAGSLAADLSQNFHIDRRYVLCYPYSALSKKEKAMLTLTLKLARSWSHLAGRCFRPNGSVQNYDVVRVTTLKAGMRPGH